MATEILHFRKTIFKNLLLRSHKGDVAETLHKYLYYALHKLCFFIAVGHVVLLLWQL